MLAPLRRRHAWKHCLGVRIGLAKGPTPRGRSARANQPVGPGRPGDGPPSPAPPKLWAMTADPVAQIQSSRMVPAASVGAILGIESLLGFFRRWSPRRADRFTAALAVPPRQTQS